MYEDWGDSDECVADLIDDHIRQLQEAPAFDYLARNGDAIQARVQACIDEAKALLGAGFPSAALVSAGTAIELTVRFFLVRPLLHGAFLSDEWAGILGARILTPGPRGPAADRELLPAILRNWGIDITGIRTKQGRQAWEDITKPGGVVETRNNYVHKGEPAPGEVCEIALECAELLLAEVVDPLATRLGFTRQETHAWRILNYPPTFRDRPFWCGCVLVPPALPELLGLLVAAGPTSSVSDCPQFCPHDSLTGSFWGGKTSLRHLRWGAVQTPFAQAART